MHAPTHRLPLVGGIAASFLAVSSLLVLAGWLVHIPYLTGWAAGMVAMNPATAVLFLLTAAAIGLCTESASRRAPKAARLGCAGLILGAALLKVAEYVSGWPIGLDRMLFSTSLGQNEMAPNTAAAFLLVGLALLAFELRSSGGLVAQTLVLFVLAIAFMSLLGYLYDAHGLYGVGRHIPMALNTATMFAITGIGLLSVRQELPIASLLKGPHLGSTMARRLLPTAVIVPCILGLLRILGQRAGLYETEFGAALMVLVTVILLIAAIGLTGSALNRIDIERQEAMQALLSSAEEVRNLYNQAPCGYCSLNTEGVVTSINDTLLTWLGYKRDEVEGTLAFESLLEPSYRASYAERYEAGRTSGQAANQEGELVRTDSSTFPVTITTLAVVDSDGRRTGARISISDATERRQAEAEIRQLNQSLEQRVHDRTAELAEANDDLAQKNQENEMFVYSVSHDLRSPLVNLQGFSKELTAASTELKTLLTGDSLPSELRQKISTLLDEDMGQSIRFINSSVTRLGNIIDALLRLSRVGRVEYQCRMIDMQAVIEGILESMASALFDADVTVTVGELPPCYGDSTAIEQLFANLIGNAVKYREPTRKSLIEIGSSNSPAEATPARLITYFVKDNGLGIPAAHQEKIFQAFKRAHPKAAPGEGMGLAIVRRTVERHGGLVSVESEEGKGSVFYVSLPAGATMRRAGRNSPLSPQGETKHGSRINGDLVGGRR